MPSPPAGSVRVVRRMAVQFLAAQPSIDILLDDGTSRRVGQFVNPAGPGSVAFQRPFVLASTERLDVAVVASAFDAHLVVEWEDEPATDWNLVRIYGLATGPSVELIPTPPAGQVHVVASLPDGGALNWFFNDDTIARGIDWFINDGADRLVSQDVSIPPGFTAIANAFAGSWGPPVALPPGQSVRVAATGVLMTRDPVVIAAYKPVTLLL